MPRFMTNSHNKTFGTYFRILFTSLSFLFSIAQLGARACSAHDPGVTHHPGVELGDLCVLHFSFRCFPAPELAEVAIRRNRNERGQQEEQVCQDILDCEPEPTEVYPYPKPLHDLRRERTVRRDRTELVDVWYEVDVRPDPHRVVHHGRDDDECPALRDVPVEEQRRGYEQPLHKRIQGDDEEVEAAPKGGMDYGERGRRRAQACAHLHQHEQSAARHHPRTERGQEHRYVCQSRPPALASGNSHRDEPQEEAPSQSYHR